MTIPTQLMSVINMITFVVSSLVHLGGVVVAIILVARRSTLGRWLVLVGIAVPALAALCNGLLPVAYGAAANAMSLDTEGYMALMTTNNTCTGALGILGYLALLIGIWLLAHEGRTDAVNENA